MEHQVKEITVRHDLHALSKFFGYAIGHNWAKRNPVEGIEIPSDADSVRMYILTQAEEMSYFQTATSEFTITVKGIIHNHGPFRDLHDVARLILLQGNRPEEIYNLQRADVDLEKGKFWVRKGKSRAARRELQLLPESREILARRLSMPASPWMFPSPKRAGLPITKLNGSHEKVLEATGLSFVLYDLRHTFATRAAERGMPLPLLAKIMGHANMRSIEKYVHPTQPALDAAMLRYGQPAVGLDEIRSEAPGTIQ
jgi:integrase